MSAGMPSEFPPPPQKTTNPLILAFLVLVATAAIGWGLWQKYFHVPVTQNTQTNLNVTGFRTPITMTLDKQFTDADGDLVADPPTDPSKLIDPPKLTFSYIEADDPEKAKAAWQPFVDYLSKVTGKPVEYLPLAGTTDLLKAMRHGQLLVAGFNTGSVPIAVDMCGFVPVCAVPTSAGSALTCTDIIVPADSPLQKPEDLKGHELTLTDPNSNSGYKAALVLLRSNFGLQPMSDLLLRYSGSHEASIEGIATKKYEAAAIAEDMLVRQTAAGEIKPSQYRSIYKSETFPTAGLGYVYNLKPELAAKIKDALLSYDWKGTELEEKFQSGSQTKFVPVNYKNDWSLIRRIDAEMGETPNLD